MYCHGELGRPCAPAVKDELVDPPIHVKREAEVKVKSIRLAGTDEAGSTGRSTPGPFRFRLPLAFSHSALSRRPKEQMSSLTRSQCQ